MRGATRRRVALRVRVRVTVRVRVRVRVRATLTLTLTLVPALAPALTLASVHMKRPGEVGPCGPSPPMYRKIGQPLPHQNRAST